MEIRIKKSDWDALSDADREAVSQPATLGTPQMGDPAVETDDQGVDWYVWDDGRITVVQQDDVVTEVNDPGSIDP